MAIDPIGPAGGASAARPPVAPAAAAAPFDEMAPATPVEPVVAPARRGTAPTRAALVDEPPPAESVMRRRPPAPDHLGLRPPAWYRGILSPDMRPLSPPRSVTASQAGATLTEARAKQLAGLDFAALARAVTTPADIAALLTEDWFFDYEDARTNGGTGPGSTYSTDEMLARRTGVCRDYHVVARDLLQQNGYNAEVIGYWAAGQRHVVTAYQDPASGKWGIMEYNSLVRPEDLQADNPVEALMIARPSALVVHQMSNRGPSERSVIDAVLYTPTMRVYEAFMRGPAPSSQGRMGVDNTGLSLEVPLDDAGEWQGKAQIVVDSRTPHMQGAVMVGAWRNMLDEHGAGFRVGAGAMAVPMGANHEIGTNKRQDNAHGLVFVSAEEFHPELFKWTAGEVSVGVSSHTELHAAASISEQDGFGDSGYTGGVVSNLKTNPEGWVEGAHDLDGDPEAELRWRATVGARLDAVAAITHWVSGGNELPANAYATLEMALEPAPWLEVGVQGYVPLANFTNDDLADPAVGAYVRTPYMTASVMHSPQGTRIRGDVHVPLEEGMQVGGFVQHTIDARNQSDHTEGGFGAKFSL